MIPRISCLLLCVSAGIWSVAHVDAQEPTSANEAAETRLANSEIANVEHWQSHGQLVVIDRWIVPAPMTGIVQKLLVQEGSQVQLGDVLAKWDVELLESELTVAKATHAAALLEADQSIDLRYAELTAKVRKAELERSLQANERYQSAVSGVELDRQRLLVDQASLSAEQSSHRESTLMRSADEKSATVSLIQKRIQRGSLLARGNGVVTELLCREGQWVTEGTPVAQVVDLSRLRIETLVDWSVAARLHVGADVVFEIDPAFSSAKEFARTPRASNAGDSVLVSHTSHNSQRDEHSFLGLVTFVSPEINPVTKQVRVIAEVDNMDGVLKPGMAGLLKSPSR